MSYSDPRSRAVVSQPAEQFALGLVAPAQARQRDTGQSPQQWDVAVGALRGLSRTQQRAGRISGERLGRGDPRLRQIGVGGEPLAAQVGPRRLQQW